MNLKDYIKNIEEFLLNEDFAEGTSEDMNRKVEELKAIKAKFLDFLQEIKEKNIDLKTIQAKVQAESGAESTTSEKSAEAPQTSGTPQSGAQPQSETPSKDGTQSQGETPPQGEPAKTEPAEDGASDTEPADVAPEGE